VRFVLFVEGHTEKKALPGFFKRWLDPQLKEPVGIQVVRFDGWPELIKDSPVKASMHLKREEVIAVVALLDLYGPKIYPNDKTTASARYEWAKQHLESKVDSQRFRQFFAVHETEAWLLSDPTLFPRPIRDALPAVSRPEEIDFDQPPSKLLGRIYRDKMRRTYKKITHGKELFDKLDPNTACGKCPRLRELLEEMLKMAKARGL